MSYISNAAWQLQIVKARLDIAALSALGNGHEAVPEMSTMDFIDMARDSYLTQRAALRTNSRMMRAAHSKGLNEGLDAAQDAPDEPMPVASADPAPAAPEPPKEEGEPDPT